MATLEQTDFTQRTGGEMNKVIPETEGRGTQKPEAARKIEALEKACWETPKMEDVSEQVMAQPYIRFT